MKAEAVGDRDRVALPDPEARPGAVVIRVAVRDDGVQAVVAARKLDDDEDALGTALEARASERLGGERR
jgi:transcription antitermination factor NusA-like protein